MDDRPRARGEGIVTEWVDQDLVVYDESTQTAHSLSAAAASVWELCDGAHSLTGIARELALGPEMVARAVAELGQCGLLDEGPLPPPGISRREAAKRLVQVGGAALAAPMIYSVAVPSAAAAAASCSLAAGVQVSCLGAACTAASGGFGTSTGTGASCCHSGVCYEGGILDPARCYCVLNNTCKVAGAACLPVGSGSANCCDPHANCLSGVCSA